MNPKYILTLAAMFATQSIIASGGEAKSSLVLSANPQVWHRGMTQGGQNIWLTMRYWGDLDGEKLTDEPWGETRIVKEFRHKLRTFKNELDEGMHTIGPIRLNFQGKEYESNLLSVRVLPPPDEFRGIRAYFPIEQLSMGKSVPLIVYEYRDDRESLSEIDLKKTQDYSFSLHGGYSIPYEGPGDSVIWIQMRHFTLSPRSKGTLTITSESFIDLGNEDVVPAVLIVTQDEQGDTE